ncbi:uncharacterized protein LOC118749409 [Rhagoletis pomonella]|uniref:uncharacterized protein LOC118749409 n=1 Tax=Rhagoletis pomonella TaxID=28610 RepID=UPI0017876512|nr:uncharacterized protein LOC118749409 [Rhagoletis pomonella]
MLMRERDRERKRMKRLNPEYRRMEQERDRDRKKARRANEAFRQLEKLRDKIRKERKKGIITEESLQAEFANIPPVPVEPEVIISDPATDDGDAPSQANSRQRALAPIASHNSRPSSTSNNCHTTPTTAMSTVAASSISAASVHIHQQAHMAQLNKSILYPPPNFAHHPLPIAGVTLMPQLCHPILHQNLTASLYPTNGIKQEYHAIKQEYNTEATASSHVIASGSHVPGASSSSNGDEREIAIIEPEIILHTSTDIIAAPHHFQNAHAHAHHLHQQQCGMFQHIAPQAHMSQMRTHPPLPPPPPASHVQQQQQQQMHQHYAANKGP